MTKVLVLGVALMSTLPHAVLAQRGRSQVQEGNRLYRDSRFEEAHQRYLDGLREAPASHLIRYNDGNALYKSEEYERAVEAYRAAAQTGDPALQAQAWYNLGNALFRQGDMAEAAGAFKQALRINPGDVDAKHNLERALQQERQQSQQQQQEQERQDRQQEQDQQGQNDQSQGQQQGDSSRQRQDEQSPERQRPGDQDKPAEGSKAPQGRPPQMTPEEAQRLLQAIKEDPSKLHRQRTRTAAQRRPRKEW